MPGNTFAAKLGNDAFPLRPTETFAILKATLAEKLKTLYKLVGVPASAPGKSQHGDIEFVVCAPISSVTPAQIQKALGAQLIAPEGASTITYYAVPTPGGKFVQVSVEVCESKSDFDGIIFFRSYGDMGMILGLLARAHGLSLGSKGLKIHPSLADSTHPSSFHISSSFPEILRFMGLSIKTWEDGFGTTKDLFAWLQTSHFFVPRLILERASDLKVKHVEKRIVFQSFLAYTHALVNSGQGAKQAIPPSTVVQEALTAFGKKAEYDSIVKANTQRLALKDKFTGNHVMKWTGLYGTAVRSVMKGVRERLGEDGVVVAKVEDIEKITKEVQQKLNLYPKKK